MSKVVLVSLKWLETIEGNKLVGSKAVEVAIPGARKLLQNQDPLYPTWIEQKDANRFNLDVSVEAVDETKTKAAPAAKATNAKGANKPRVQSKEALEAAKADEAAEAGEGAEGGEENTGQE